MNKSDIRNKYLKIRKKKFNLQKNISFNLIKNFIFKNKKKPTIGGYFPVSYEIDCLKILKKLEEEKIRISLPIIQNNNEMEFHKYSFKNPMNINKYGIPEPFKNKVISPDILFVPLVAFDKNLFRIGYGGGYYDRYLAKLKKKKIFISIGLAFSFQKVEKIPLNSFDKKLDIVITEKQFYK